MAGSKQQFEPPPNIEGGVAYNSDSYQNYILNSLISEGVLLSLHPTPQNLHKWLYVLQAIERTILPKLNPEHIKAVEAVRMDGMGDLSLPNAFDMNRRKLIKYENVLRQVATAKKMLMTDSKDLGNLIME